MQNLSKALPRSPQKNQPDMPLTAHLKKVFGFSSFRPDQEKLIREILRGRDVCAVMPTGGGKSLCYQLPAHILKGTCVVISPLISLMKDQVDAALDTGLRAAFLNSSMTSGSMSSVYSRLKRGMIDLLYVSPERFAMEDFLATLSSLSLCLFAIDEAHCISEWGHDFRPDYLSLTTITARFPNVPVAAFTATATQRVQDDTIARLAMRNPFIIRASFNRPNLFYQVLPKNGIEEQIIHFLRERPGESGIIYRTSRSSVEETAALLVSRGISALPYHAGLAPGERTKNQEVFNRDGVQVMVATIAFGMGIDKSNIRFVVHADLPKNMEGYYQETGRAGRDNEPAHCLLFFSRGDIPKIRYFIDQIAHEQERSTALKKLSSMADYAGINVCRRRQILAYFGESYAGKNCGACDICADHSERIDATREAQIIMSAMVRAEQRFGANHIIDIVTGAQTKKMVQLGHDRLKTFGIGHDRDGSFWHTIINELVGQECISRSGDRYPILHLLPKGTAILLGKARFTVLKREESVKRRKMAAYEDYNEELFTRLQALRKRIADDRNLPAFVIFSDKTLHDMCRKFPTAPPELLKVAGVGRQKMDQYGTKFIAVIKEFVNENPSLAPLADRKPEKAGQTKILKKGKSLAETLLLAQKGLSYVAIAARRGLAVSTIAEHIERLLTQGHKIDIDQQVAETKRSALTRAFNSAEDMSLGPIVEQLGGQASYEEARIVRGYLSAHNKSKE